MTRQKLTPSEELDQSQNPIDRFAELARSLECDEDEGRWEDRLKAVVKHKPVAENPD